MRYSEISAGLKTDKIIQLLYRLGATSVAEKEGYLITNTICHNVSDGSMKLYYYYDTHLFVCYTSEGPMSIFTFLKNYYETRRQEYDWYSDIYLVALSCCENIFSENEINFEPKAYVNLREKYTERRILPPMDQYSDGVLDCFEQHYYTPEWLNDGISPAAMDKYDIRYSISQNKIIIPHRDVEGRLIGIRGRALNEEEANLYGKYMPVMVENQIYAHKLSLNLYGLYENLENLKKHRIVYVFESEKSVLQFDGFNMPNCSVAICGSNFNKYQMRLLMKYVRPKEVVLCLDNEEAPGQDEYFNKLYSICSKYKYHTQMSFIYDRKNLTDLKDSPTDKGEDIFLQLLNSRVKVK